MKVNWMAETEVALKALPFLALITVCAFGGSTTDTQTITLGGQDGTLRAIAHQRDIQAAEASVARQAGVLGCASQTPRMGARVAVRDASTSLHPASTVVRVVSFDEAWKLAHAHEVWVVGYCTSPSN